MRWKSKWTTSVLFYNLYFPENLFMSFVLSSWIWSTIDKHCYLAWDNYSLNGNDNSWEIHNWVYISNINISLLIFQTPTNLVTHFDRERIKRMRKFHNNNNATFGIPVLKQEAELFEKNIFPLFIIYSIVNFSTIVVSALFLPTTNVWSLLFLIKNEWVI